MEQWQKDLTLHWLQVERSAIDAADAGMDHGACPYPIGHEDRDRLLEAFHRRKSSRSSEGE